MRACNWLQGLEGDIDTSHAPFLHSTLKPKYTATPGTLNYYSERTKQPSQSLVERDYGMLYANCRPAEEDSYLWSIGQFLLPFYTMVNSINLGESFVTRAWVPIDDEHTMFVYMWWAPEGLREEDPTGKGPHFSFMRNFDHLPNTSDWLGRWRLVANAENDYQLDREVQRTRTFSGVPTVHNQDQAMTESMGAITDHSREHLSAADRTIVLTRQILRHAARNLSEREAEPATVDQPQLYATRSGRVILPRDADWVRATEEQRKAFSGSTALRGA
jgi:hypothetical protein